jgi:hypothetical protein
MRLAANVGGLPSFAVQLRAARSRDQGRDFHGECELYCEAPSCSARTVVVAIKELDAWGHTVIPRCPLCHAPLKTHCVRTAREAAADARREARCLVNVEVWKRDHPGQLGVPLSVYLDDRLPGDAQQ